MSKLLEKKITPIYDYVYYDKEICKYEDATIGLAANTLQYGTSVFSGIRGFANENGVFIFRLEDHWKRLMEACRIMCFDYYITYEEFKEILTQMVEKNNVDGKFYIRAFVFCDKTYTGPKLKILDFDLAIYFQEMDEYAAVDRPFRLMVSSFIKYSDNSISTKSKVNGSYVNSMLAIHQANISGFDDALMVNENGYIVEASVACIIGVKDGKIIIPPKVDGALNGITVRTSIELLQNLGYEVNEESFNRSSIYVLDELILNGTAMTIKQVGEVEGRMIGDVNNAPVFKALQEEWDKVLTLKHEFSKEWMVKIK